MNKKKIFLANTLSFIGIDEILLFFRKYFYKGNYIYALYYHDTPEHEISSLEQQLFYFKKHFSSVNQSDLNLFFANKEWHKDKPGLILSFDDGLRSNFDFAAPLIEKYGFTAWFFITTDFLDVPISEQFEFAKNHSITVRKSYRDSRLAMTWDEVRQLDKNHVIGSHTKSHKRMEASTTETQIHQEIALSKKYLEEKLGHQVDIFCWVGGEEQSYSAQGAKAIREANYKYSFMTNCMPIKTDTNPLQLQRNNIETSWSINLARFSVSGVMDLLYYPKRKRVNNLTA